MEEVGTCNLKQEGLDSAMSLYLQDSSEENLQSVFLTAGALIHHYANLYSGSFSIEDIVQAGYEGLMKAIHRFDHQKDVRFVTFASHYIMGEMRRHLRAEASFDRPGWVADLQSRIYMAIEDLSHQLGEPPTMAQIAEKVNIKEEGVHQALKAGWVNFDDLDLEQVKSLHYNNFQLPLEEKILLQQAMDSLNELQKDVIYQIFYRGLTQQQVADRIGVGQRRVSRLMRRGLENMAKYIA